MMRILLAAAMIVIFAADAVADCGELPTAEERRSCLVRERCPEAQTDAERAACYERLLDEYLTGNDPPLPAVHRGAAETIAADAESRFGLTLRMRHPADTELDELHASVEQVAVAAHRRRVVRLDNGQVWEETEARNTGVSAGDRVVIRRATFGSFRMFVEDHRRTTTVRRLDCDDAEADTATRRKCSAMGH